MVSSLKRIISIEEKTTIRSTSGKALVFLGDEGCPEINELIAVGFQPGSIFGIDKDPCHPNDSGYNVYTARYIYNDIPPENFSCVLFRDFGYFNQTLWSYVHLDYCGLPWPKCFDDIYNAAEYILPGGRLRVTFINAKRWRNSREVEFNNPEEIEVEIYDHIYIHGFGHGHSVLYRSGKRRRAPMVTMWFDRE